MPVNTPSSASLSHASMPSACDLQSIQPTANAPEPTANRLPSSCLFPPGLGTPYPGFAINASFSTCAAHPPDPVSSPPCIVESWRLPAWTASPPPLPKYISLSTMTACCAGLHVHKRRHRQDRVHPSPGTEPHPEFRPYLYRVATRPVLLDLGVPGPALEYSHPKNPVTM